MCPTVEGIGIIDGWLPYQVSIVYTNHVLSTFSHIIGA